MAVSTTTTLNRYMFVSELMTLTFRDVPESGLLLSIKHGGDVVFQNKYIASADGSVTVFDLDILLENHIAEVSDDFTFTVNGSDLTPGVITVIRCSGAVSEPATSFITDFFLSASASDRDTVMGRKELLTAFCLDTEQVTVDCKYLKPDGSVYSSAVTLDPVSGAASIDVSPALFAVTGVQLISYTVTCGDRKMGYRVLPYSPEADTAFLFRNRFNTWETFHMTGKKETSPAYTRSNAVIGGRLRNYAVEEVVSYQAMTGPLRQGMEFVALDVAQSKDVFLLNNDGTAGDEVTITDTDLKFSNEQNLIVNLTFTYRLASRRNIKIAAPRMPRIFDRTFDDEFE